MRASTLYDFVGIQPILTLRGLALEALLLYFLVGPVTHRSDIVASVLSFSLLGIHIILGTITLLKGRSLRRSFSLKVLKAEEFVAGRLNYVTLKLSAFRLPPFFLLRVELVFKDDGVVVPVSVFSGRSAESQAVREEISFPHRGNWEIAKISIELADRFGLTSYGWNLNSTESREVCEVGVPPPRVANLPVVSSSRRAGDAIPHPYDRLGDPFDFKQYHPSDGLKKLLWKVYARSGELISRHPESTMTPEGRVALYCIAGKKDDAVCADCLEYVRGLSELGLELLLGCGGMQHRPIARTTEEFRRLLLDTVWTSDAKLPDEIGTFVSLAEREMAGSILDKIAIFCAAEQFDDEEGLERCADIGRSLAVRGIKPIFFIRQRGEYLAKGMPLPSEGRLAAQIAKIFVEQPEKPVSGQRYLNKFLGICGGNHWEVVR